MSFSTSPDIKEALYKNHLCDLSGVKFTLREIDIISCILHNRGEKKIAVLLSISHKTVSAHVHNIMNKLSNSSRDYIIDFVEKSGKLQIVRQYYLHLLIQSTFDKKLQTLAKHISDNEYSCEIHFEESDKEAKILAKQLQEYFKLLRIAVTLAGVITQNNNISLSQTKHCNLYITKDPSTVYSSSPDAMILLLSPNVSDEKMHKIDFSSEGNFYLSFLKLLENIFSKSQLAQITQEFEQEYLSMQGAGNDINIITTNKADLSTRGPNMMYNNQFLVPHIVIVIGMIIIIVLLLYAIITKTTPSTNAYENNHIHSELIVPSDVVFLDRSDLLREIDSKLSGKNVLKIVAIVGSGGSGKTTLARKYAHSKKVDLAWEINAETIENINHSFNLLARALAKTPEDKQLLLSIDEIRNATLRHEQIVNFVKGKLSATPNWILIYDNADRMGDLIKYFPINTDVLESGKIIITTRDSNINNNQHIDSVIHIGELSKDQKLQLFLKMLKNNGNSNLSVEDQITNADRFLDAIPPFPLDVAIAAKYIASTRISFDKYLEYLANNPDAFHETQQAILQNESDYKNTRYSIISLSLQQLTDGNRDFMDLLLLMCLLDSQNIPRDILDKYKSTAVVDNFLYNLKTYSLITNESSSTMGQAFSIHRSTQYFIISYLLQRLDLIDHPELVEPFIKFLGSYIDDVIEQEDLTKIRGLLTHCQGLVSGNKQFLTDVMRGYIEGKLGRIYYYLSYNTEAGNSLESSVTKLYTNYDLYYDEIAQDLIYLGLVKMYIVADNDRSAEAILKQSLEICNKHLPPNDSKIAEILVHLGRIEIRRNNFQKAEELLKHGLKIYRLDDKKYYSQIAWALRYLGNMYREKGDYQNAKKCLTESIDIYTTHHSKNNAKIYVSYVYLGSVYRDLGDYKKSVELLEKAVSFSQEHYGERRPWALVHLGNSYEKLGNYNKAKELFETSIACYSKSFASNHNKMIWANARLGSLYGKLGHYDQAISILQQSLDLMYEQSRSKIYAAFILERLGTIYTDLLQYEKSKELLERAMNIYLRYWPKDHIAIGLVLSILGKNEALSGNFQKSKALLEESLAIHEKHYGKNHIETTRVLVNIARNYLIHGDLAAAESVASEANDIFKDANHPDIYLLLELSADLSIAKAGIEKSVGNNASSKAQKVLAISKLEEALKVINSNFPNAATSAHTLRIRAKLENIFK